MKPDDKKFLALQAEWDKKLALHGFKDAEDRKGNLIDWHGHKTAKYDPLVFEVKQDYYRLAGQFLYEYKFKNKKEKLVWANHSMGVSIRNIVKHLGKQGIKTYKQEVHRIVRYLAREMVTTCKK